MTCPCMRLYRIAIPAMIASLSVAAEPSPLTLSEAAAKVTKNLKKGAVVSAEAKNGVVQYAATGTLEPAGAAPEKVIFEIGSISKVFTGLLLAQAVLEKKLTLDTTLRDLMGENQKFADPKVADITPRQLATHTSGLPRLPSSMIWAGVLPDPYAGFTRELLDAAVGVEKLEGTPPFPQSYSNFGVGLLGDLLSRVYNKPWSQLVRERITEPLGLHDTVVILSDEQKQRFAPAYSGEKSVLPWTFTALAGAGALRSTAADMVKFGEALLSPGKTPLKDAIELMLQPHSDTKDIGLAIMLSKFDGQELREHNGGTGGYRSLLQVIPATQSVRVILCNNSEMEPAGIIAAMRNEKPRLVESDKVITAEKLAEYEGVYPIDAEGRFTVLRRDDQLWTQLTGQSFLRLFPHEKEDRFFLKVAAAEIQFHRENGKIVSLTNHQNGRELDAKKSDLPAPKIIFRSAKELEEFTGTYDLTPFAKFTIKARGETLLAQLTGQPFLPVFEKSKDRFEYDVVEAALEFERDKDGRIVAVKLHQNGIVQRAPKKP
ncbi:hypothetical protein AYO49_00975 [Verrucomicrobiaceae bacterium SCGC AG-212-N21]|nr:hypothetical protein AYO49_00975 [Verrucomicrobiaceae bacterium SCGC AG-212-N21]